MASSPARTTAWVVVIVVVIGLWSLTSGQRTTDHTSGLCVDFMASSERAKILADIETLSDHAKDECGRILKDIEALFQNATDERGRILKEIEALSDNATDERGRILHDIEALSDAATDERGGILHDIEALSDAATDERGRILHDIEALSDNATDERGRILHDIEALSDIATDERGRILHDIEALSDAATDERGRILHDIEALSYTATDERVRISADIASLSDQVRTLQATLDASLLQGCGLNMSISTEYESHRYVLGYDPLTWTAARNRCYQCGYSLAKIESRAESEFIQNWIRATAVPPPQSRVVWIDGTDLNHGGCWVWTYPEVTPLSPDEGFAFWGPDQPNNPLYHCASMWYLRRIWYGHNGPCYDRIPYLCEKAPGPRMNLPSMDQVRNTIPCGQ